MSHTLPRIKEIKLDSKFLVIRQEGGSKVITITQFLPKDWKAVEVSKVNETDTDVTLKFEKVA